MRRSVLAVLFLALTVGCFRVNDFSFPRVERKHEHMRALLINAMGYIDPEHGLIDEASGYPVEGWNHDPELGLHLRSFTQLTSIGEWVEMLANIAAGYADNPYISRQEALKQLEKTVDSLLADQADPDVSAKGLMGNFLGLAGDKRLGPLCENVFKEEFIEEFGETKGGQIWTALARAPKRAVRARFSALALAKRKITSPRQFVSFDDLSFGPIPDN